MAGENPQGTQPQYLATQQGTAALQPPSMPPQFPPQPYYQQVSPPQYVVAVAQPTNGMGTAAGVLGIIAIVLAVIPFVQFTSFVLGLLAVILGGIGIRRANSIGGAGRGMAITGLVTGLIALVITILLISVVFASIYAVTNAVNNAIGH
jgi:hypothetical protein